MKATGQLIFREEQDRTISRTWIGGRRIAVSSQLIETWTEERARIGQVITFGDDVLRLIAPAHITEGQGWQNSYIAMREGRLARFVWRYWQWLSDHAPSLFHWECRWIRWRKPVGGEVYPKWSLVGILSRPLL